MQETPVASKSNAHIFVLGYVGGQEGYRKNIITTYGVLGPLMIPT